MKINEILKYLDRQTLTELSEKSNAWGCWQIFFNYSLIFLSFALVYFYPNVLSVLLSMTIIAGRQLGLAILMHDASHRTLFKTKSLNQIVGQFLCAAPVGADLDRYRDYHNTHHRKTGTDQDPDRSNYINYPVAPDSFRRKVFRDLCGITGFKTLLIVYKMNANEIDYQLSYELVEKKGDGPKGFRVAIKSLAFPISFNILFAVLVSILFNFWTYLLWPISWLTIYMLFSRIRNAAEHAVTTDVSSEDIFYNTRTTHASWWERLTVAPNYVNFHLEHHLLPSIPGQNLKLFHHKIQDLPIYRQEALEPGYISVVRKLLK